MGSTATPFDNIVTQGPGTQPGSNSTPSDSATPFDSILPQPSQGTQTTPSPDEASNTRQMLVSGLTGIPTPNMTDADKASFARGKAAGAISVPVVAGATLAGTAAPEVVPQIVQKAKDVAQWAKANPIKSVVLAKIADELGIHPFDFLHKITQYGKNLFGGDEK